METFGPLAFAALDMEIKVPDGPNPVQSDVSRFDFFQLWKEVRYLGSGWSVWSSWLMQSPIGGRITSTRRLYDAGLDRPQI